MSSIRKKQILFLQVLAILFVTAVSCNSKTTDDESEVTYTSGIVAVKSFYLQENDSIMANLDSVFFAIDLNTGVIFNADSLPAGTNISRLVPSITFANTMTKVDIIFYKDDDPEPTTVDYLTTPTDSIDFSSPVLLEVTAQDGVSSFTYTIKVNVHRQDPALVAWDNLSYSSLPSRFEDPVVQKTIMHDDIAYCLIEEYNDEYTLAICADLNEGDWTKEPFDPGFVPDIESFTATPDAFYLSNVYGQLYYSYDLETWTDTEEKWTYVLGAYGDVVLGIKNEGADFLHTQYPRPEGYEESVVEEGFPIYHSSALGVIENRWAPNPTAILACGMAAGGYISSNVWGYDGTSWAIINSGALPELELPMLARYVVYRDTPAVFTQREFDIWLLFGGVNFDGEMNREVYMSYDNGVHWSLAPEGMQLPELFPNLLGADVVVASYDLSADLADAWTLMETKTRASYNIEGYEITWKCPYLYVFGGSFPYPDNSLNTSIYRGVLQKLQFTPDI